jgi:hypothetical protein
MLYDQLYGSDFGLIDISSIPDEFKPVYPNAPELEKLLEASYCRGDNIVGTSRLVVTEERIEGEPTGRLIYAIEIPITGFVTYEVARKEKSIGPDSPAV